MIQNDAPSPALSARNVLIVEDDALLACNLEDVVCDCGARPVGPAFSLSSALELAKSEHLDAALLDINLGDDLVWPLAIELKEAGIPFAFLSAACSRFDLPDSLKGSVCMDKPATSQEIVSTLGTLLES